MKPPVFDYHAPASLAEALTLLEQLRTSWPKVLAGGQSLMPMLNQRLIRPSHLIDINHLAELNYVRELDNNMLAIGALTRYKTVEASGAIERGAPLWFEAVPYVADRQVRARGTVGGSLAHADPAAELPVVAVASDAEVVVIGPKGQRVVASEELFVSALSTVLDVAELVTEVRVPRADPGTGHAFVEFARQHGARAIVSAAAVLSIRQGTIVRARLCIGGAGPRPIRIRRAEERLRGGDVSSTLFAEAAGFAATDTAPVADVHGSVEYRRQLARVCADQALHTAARRVSSGAEARAW